VPKNVLLQRGKKKLPPLGKKKRPKSETGGQEGIMHPGIAKEQKEIKKSGKHGEREGEKKRRGG